MTYPNFKRTLLSSAIVLACYGNGAFAACPGTVSGAEGPCALGGTESVTITATGTLPSVTIAAPGTGTINNAGAVAGAANNTRALNYAGDLGVGGNLTNSGSLRNTAVAAINSVTAVFIGGALSGTLDNSGTIVGKALEANPEPPWHSGLSQHQANGIVIDGGDLSGTLTNSGTIAGEIQATSWGSAVGLNIRNGNLSGTLNNSGTIKASPSFAPIDNSDDEWAPSNYAVYIDGDLSGTLTNSGLVISEFVGAGDSQGATLYGIYIGNDITADGSLANSGTIRARVEADSGGTVYGVYVDDDMQGSLTNSGLIDAVVLAPTSGAGAAGVHIDGNLEGTLNNSGTVNAQVEGSTWGSAYGIYVDDDITTTGRLTNSGNVSATVMNTLAGTDEDRVTAQAYGIYVGGTMEGMLDNRGSVTATATGDATANPTADWLSVEAYGVLVDDVTGALSNSGVINASASLITPRTSTNWNDSAIAAGIAVEGDLTGALSNTGTIMATASATAGSLPGTRGFGAEAYGISIDDEVTATGTVTNTGLIEANASVVGGDAVHNTRLKAYGIYVDGNFSGTLNNSGSITATIDGVANPTQTAEFAIFIDGDSSAGTFTNSGTITGAVQLNGGTLNLNGGRIIGPITSVNPLDVNIGGVQISSLTDLFGANVDAFTVVNGGDWQLDAAMVDVASFAVMSGGRLSFTANAALVENVPNAGTVAVNSGVTGTITGNYTQATGGTFETISTMPNNFGHLVVSGTADLSASGAVSAQVNGTRLLRLGQVDDVLAAGTLVAGALTTTDNSLLYDLTAVLDGNTIDLTVARGLLLTDAVIAANLPYALGAAGALDGLLDTGGNGGPIDQVLAQLASLGTANEMALAVAELVPNLAGQGALASQQIANMFSSIVGNRLTGGPGLSAGDAGMYEEGHFWLKPFGGYANANERDNVPGLDAQTYGISLGADLQLNDQLLVGAGFAWAESEIDGKTLNVNELDIQSYQLVLYGDYDLTPTDFVEGYAIVGFNDNETRRDMQVGSFRATARGDYDSIFTRIYTGLGRTYQQSEQWTFAPVLALRYTYLDQDSYDETNAGPLNLEVRSDDADSLILGLDGVGTYTFGNAGIYALMLRGGVGYDVLTDRTLLTSAFAGGGGVFATQGAEPDEFVYRGGVGLKAMPENGMTIRLDYEFEGRSDYQSHGGSFNLRWQF